MKIGLLILVLCVQTVYASFNVRDTAALQRGARLYMNYCSGCHALKYMRYNKMAKALGLTTFDGEIDTDLLKDNLMWTTATIHDPIRIAMPEKDARQWFGVAPPDLSLVARARGERWLFQFLNGFYEDPKRPFGSNNLVFQDVGMPDVLYSLRGRVVLTKQGLVHVTQGEISDRAFRKSLHDLVTFLVYVGEPIQVERQSMGWKIVVFLLVFLAFVYALKRWYWSQL